MGEIIVRKVKGMNWTAKISLVLIFTLVFSTFMYQGLYKPKKAEAAITTVAGNAWSQIYSNQAGARPGTIAYTVNAGSGSNRLLVVAVSTETNAAGAETLSITYGTRSMTSVRADGGATQAHSYLFYLNEANLDLASNSNLVFTFGGAAAALTAVYATVFDGVDQTTPITGNTGNTATTNVTLTTPIVPVANEVTVEVVSMGRATNGTARTITGPAANWSITLTGTARTDGTRMLNPYILTDTTAGSTAATHTISSATASTYSMSAMRINPAPTGDTLTTSAPTNLTTGNPADGAQNLDMLRFQVVSNNVQNGNVELSTLTMADSGNATSIANAEVYISTVSQATLPGGAVLLGSVSSWNGNSTVINLTGGTAADRTVTNGTPNYIYIVYDLSSGQVGNTIQAQVTAVGVASPDTGATGLNYQSTIRTIQPCTDPDPATLTITSPTSGTSVSGTKVIQVQVGTETAPATMTGMQVDIAGAGACNVTGGVMSWNAGTSRWEYSWNTSACGTVTPVTGVTINASGNDPNCGTAVNAAVVNNITIDNTKLPSTVTSCGSCHAYPPTDGTARNNPAGSVVGSHSRHGDNCSYCHVPPATQTSADYGHRDGNINMANPIFNTGGTYSATGYPNILQTKDRTAGLSTCSSVQCHKNSLGNMVTTPTWGQPITNEFCYTCHNNQLLASGPAAAVNKRRVITSYNNTNSSDFNKTVKHVKTAAPDAKAPSDATCKACHTDTHYWFESDPNAALKDADTGARIDYAGTGASIEIFCNKCHDANGANGNTDPFGAEGGPAPNINWTVGTVAHSQSAGTGAGSIAQDKCMACHGDEAGTAGNTLTPKLNAHGSSQPKLMRYAYTAGAEQTFCYNCHGTVPANGAVDNIQSMFARTVPHANANCAICHNKHRATDANPLSGMGGVDPSSPAAGGQPTFTQVTVTDPDLQYKVCFTCHSNWSTGSTLNVDIAFNTNNDSFHWVEKDKYTYTVNTGTGKGIWQNAQFNQNAVPTQGTRKYVEVMMPGRASYTDAALRTTSLRCSDCHGPNDADGGVAVPEGPHGSTVANILKVPGGSNYTQWNSTVNYQTNSGSIWCFNCHHNNFTGTGMREGSRNLHLDKHDDWACQYCHLANPHGQTAVGTANQRKHLLKPSVFTEGVDSEQSGNWNQHGSWVIPGCT